jgi:transcriptional regulator with XRE-family HTH domain
MTLQGGRIKIQNRLWKARKRRGLAQKQVAFLIGKSIGEVSRYEKGVRLPELQTVLALEIVYGAPIRVLYGEQYEQTLTEILQRIKSGAGTGTIYANLLAQSAEATKHFCAYEDMFQIAAKSASELGHVRDHVTSLAKKLAGL